jgi:hypothetical protein
MGKKTFKKKEEYLTIESYTKKYQHLYANKEYSDFTIYFENSNEQLNTHKILLYCGSKFFENIINENKNEITIPKEINPKIFCSVVKYLYTGEFEYSDSSELLQYIIISSTVK